MFRPFSPPLMEDDVPPFNPNICLIALTSEVNVINEHRGSPGNPGYGAASRVQKLNLQTGNGSAGRCHCPAVETVGRLTS